jgi:hypothetical protein
MILPLGNNLAQKATFQHHWASLYCAYPFLLALNTCAAGIRDVRSTAQSLQSGFTFR